VFTSAVKQTGIERIDLLFMIDNSASMSDKQRILETAVPDLVDRLVNPVCIDADGLQHPAAPPGERCPDGQNRQFRAVTDINVGVISSSLGDVGANDEHRLGAGHEQAGQVVPAAAIAAAASASSSSVRRSSLLIDSPARSKHSSASPFASRITRKVWP